MKKLLLGIQIQQTSVKLGQKDLKSTKVLQSISMKPKFCLDLSAILIDIDRA